MTAAVMGTPVTSANPNTTTNTSLSVTLATTTVGQLNVIEISGLAVGTTINPTMATPAGWTKLLERIDTNGTPASFVAIYYRAYQSGDGSSVTISWTNAGQMVAVCTPWSSQDGTTPIPYSVSDFKVASDANYSIAGTTGTDAGLLCYGFANRTGAAWSALTDVDRGQVGLASSATMVARVTAAEVAAGTTFTKSAVGSTTSVGVSWAYVVKGAATAYTGAATLSGSGTLTATATATQPGAASLTGSGTLSASTGPTVAATATLSGAGTLTASSASPVDLWLAAEPFYCAHRGGSADWVESTLYAYSQAAAWSPSLALEVSCWRTSDGVWVASHDQTTGRVFGTNLDIPTTTWADLSALRTTVGGYPMARLIDVLTAHPSPRVIYADNKSGSNNAEFLDLLDANGGPARTVIKMYYTATSLVPAAHARGYKTWGYYYDADVTKTAPNLASTQANYDIIGMDYLASSSSWTAAKSYGKPVMAHIVDSSTAKTTALGYGADGMMVSKVTTVVPQAGFTGTASLSGSGALSAAASVALSVGVALSGAGSLAGTGSPSVARPVALSGSGALSVAGTPHPAATAALAGTGALTATGTASQAGTANVALTGTGTLTSTGRPAASATLPLTGGGTLAATAIPATSGTAALTGAGTLTANGSGSQQGDGTAVAHPTLTLTGSDPTLTLTTPASTLELT